MKKKIIKFHKINFYNYDIKDIYEIIINKGGYLVAPAASALSKIKENKTYHKSLINSNIAIFDSGFFCILLRIFKFQKVKKLSGFLFLKTFLDNFNNKDKILFIDPSKKSNILNVKFLKYPAAPTIRILT